MGKCNHECTKRVPMQCCALSLQDPTSPVAWACRVGIRERCWHCRRQLPGAGAWARRSLIPAAVVLCIAAIAVAQCIANRRENSRDLGAERGSGERKHATPEAADVARRSWRQGTAERGPDLR